MSPRDRLHPINQSKTAKHSELVSIVSAMLPRSFTFFVRKISPLVSEGIIG